MKIKDSQLGERIESHTKMFEYWKFDQKIAKVYWLTKGFDSEFWQKIMRKRKADVPYTYFLKYIESDIVLSSKFSQLEFISVGLTKQNDVVLIFEQFESTLSNINNENVSDDLKWKYFI